MGRGRGTTSDQGTGTPSDTPVLASIRTVRERARGRSASVKGRGAAVGGISRGMNSASTGRGISSGKGVTSMRGKCGTSTSTQHVCISTKNYFNSFILLFFSYLLFMFLLCSKHEL